MYVETYIFILVHGFVKKRGFEQYKCCVFVVHE